MVPPKSLPAELRQSLASSGGSWHARRGRTAWHVASASRIIIHAGGFGSPRELSVPSSRVPPRGPRVVAKFAKFAGSAKCPKCPPSAQGRQMLLGNVATSGFDSRLVRFYFPSTVGIACRGLQVSTRGCGGTVEIACRGLQRPMRGRERTVGMAYSCPREDVKGTSGWRAAVRVWQVRLARPSPKATRPPLSRGRPSRPAP